MSLAPPQSYRTVTEDVASACCPRLAAPSPRSTLSQKSISSNFIFIRHLTPKEYPTLTHHRIPFPPLEHPPRSHISRSPPPCLVFPFTLSSGTQHPPHIASNSSFNSKLSNYELCLYSNSLYRTGSSPLLLLYSSTHPPILPLLFTRAHPSAFRTLRALRVLRISYFIPIFKLGNDSPSINLLSGFIILTSYLKSNQMRLIIASPPLLSRYFLDINE